MDEGTPAKTNSKVEIVHSELSRCFFGSRKRLWCGIFVDENRAVVMYVLEAKAALEIDNARASPFVFVRAVEQIRTSGFLQIQLKLRV